MAANPDSVRLTERARALIDLALALTRRPAAPPAAELVDALRAHGFTDRGLHDAVNIVAYFSYVNRVALGLRVELEPEG